MAGRAVAQGRRNVCGPLLAANECQAQFERLLLAAEALLAVVIGKAVPGDRYGDRLGLR